MLSNTTGRGDVREKALDAVQHVMAGGGVSISKTAHAILHSLDLNNYVFAECMKAIGNLTHAGDPEVVK